MPATTHRGYQYPPTTGVRPAVPQHMQAFLDQIDGDMKSVMDVNATQGAALSGLSGRVTALEGRPAYTRGVVSGATSSTGTITVTHGLGATPAVVMVQPVAGTAVDTVIGQVFVGSRTTTTFVLVFRRRDTGDTLNSNPVSFNWVAIA